MFIEDYNPSQIILLYNLQELFRMADRPRGATSPCTNGCHGWSLPLSGGRWRRPPPSTLGHLASNHPVASRHWSLATIDRRPPSIVGHSRSPSAVGHRPSSIVGRHQSPTAVGRLPPPSITGCAGTSYCTSGMASELKQRWRNMLEQCLQAGMCKSSRV